MPNRSPVIRKYFAGSDGKLVLWQRPNLPLAGWIGFKLLELAAPAGAIQAGFGAASIACLIIWAFLEAVSGASTFRKTLGIAVLLWMAYSFFK